MELQFEFFGTVLEATTQVSINNGYLIGYQDAGELGSLFPLVVLDEKLAEKYPPLDGIVAGWKHPGFQNGTYDPAEGWFVQETPEGSIVVAGNYA